jgi:N6-adenosine-specific RNA methylase IME4
MLKIDEEFKALIPPLSNEEFQQLEKNCIEEGIRDAIIVWTGTDIIIDGHNRYEIAQKHNIKYQTFGKGFDSRDKVIEWMIMNQFGRRNLSAYQRSLLALRLKPVFEEKAKENLRVAAETTNNKLYDTPCQKSDKPLKEVDTKKELSKIAGVSHDTIAKVQKIEEKAPEKVKEQIKSGEISINQAYQQVRRSEKIEAIKEIVVSKSEESKSIDIHNPLKKYNIIYSDPAWSYFESGNNNQSLHYNTMSIEDICKLPVKNLADENCILFLWVTFPILQESFKVIESWGFKYSTCGFNWIKKNKVSDTNFFGCGAWTRANSELCLISTKGSVLRIDNTISQVVETPIEGHSKKPEVIRELITRLVGELPRIELFCRDAKDGWDCWGDMV